MNKQIGESLGFTWTEDSIEEGGSMVWTNKANRYGASGKSKHWTCVGMLEKRRKTCLIQVGVIRRDLKKHAVTST